MAYNKLEPIKYIVERSCIGLALRGLLKESCWEKPCIREIFVELGRFNSLTEAEFFLTFAMPSRSIGEHGRTRIRFIYRYGKTRISDLIKERPIIMRR